PDSHADRRRPLPADGSRGSLHLSLGVQLQHSAPWLCLGGGGLFRFGDAGAGGDAGRRGGVPAAKAKRTMRQRLLPGFVSEWKWDLRRIITVLILLVVCLVWVYPFLWMVSASLKTSREIFASGLNLVPSEWRWENYERAWVQANFSRYMINTVVITVATVALVVFHTSLSGYVLGRFKFIGQRFILGLLVATVFVPLGYTIIPTVQIAG